jgi:hypothetical protein
MVRRRMELSRRRLTLERHHSSECFLPFYGLHSRDTPAYYWFLIFTNALRYRQYTYYYDLTTFRLMWDFEAHYLAFRYACIGMGRRITFTISVLFLHLSSPDHDAQTLRLFGPCNDCYGSMGAATRVCLSYRPRLNTSPFHLQH